MYDKMSYHNQVLVKLMYNAIEYLFHLNCMIENTCWLMVIMNVNSVAILKSMNVINDKCVINSLISKMLRWLVVYDGLLQIKFSMS